MDSSPIYKFRDKGNESPEHILGICAPFMHLKRKQMSVD